jgi:hypothetical protein
MPRGIINRTRALVFIRFYKQAIPHGVKRSAGTVRTRAIAMH